MAYGKTKKKAAGAGGGDLDDFFEEAAAVEEDFKHRLIAIFHGAAKTGKTRLACSAPGPIAYLTNDRSYIGPVKYAISCGKEIRVSKFFWQPPPKHLHKDAAVVQQAIEDTAPLFDRFEQAYAAALHSPKIRSIIIDNGTLVDVMCKVALFGKTQKILPRDRGPYNDRMQRLYSMAHDFDKNVVWIHRTKETWRQDKPTGEFEPEGFKWCKNEIHAIVETNRHPKKAQFSAVITDSCYDAEIIGAEVEGEDLKFSKIAEAVMKIDAEEFEDGVEL